MKDVWRKLSCAEAIATLDTKESLFFDHRDPQMVKTLGEVKLNI